MGAFIVYDDGGNIVQTIRCSIKDDQDGLAAAIWANTPEGCVALEVPESSPALTNGKGWKVVRGQVVPK